MYTNIKTFEDACNAVGINPEHLPEVGNLPQDLGEYIVNMYKLSVINQAINGQWRADYGNHDQLEWFPWFKIKKNHVSGSAGGFSFFDCSYALTLTSVGARLAYETEEQAEYAGKTFTDLYEKVYLIPNA